MDWPSPTPRGAGSPVPVLSRPMSDVTRPVPGSDGKTGPFPNSDCNVRCFLGDSTVAPPKPWPLALGSPPLGPSFLGARTYPDSFPPSTPSTPTLPEFTPGPPPISYQSDVPSSLLTPEKSAPCLPGQVSAGPRGRGAEGLSPREPRGPCTTSFSPPSDGTSWSPGPSPQPWATGAAHPQPRRPPRAPAAPPDPSPSVPAAPGPSELGPCQRAGLQCCRRRDGAPNVWGRGGPRASPGCEYQARRGEHTGAWRGCFSVVPGSKQWRALTPQ